MYTKKIFLSLTGLTLISLGSLTFSMENFDPSEIKKDSLETQNDQLQVLKKLLDNGATITDYDLEFSKKNNLKAHELFLKTLEERRKKKESKEELLVREEEAEVVVLEDENNEMIDADGKLRD